MTRTIAFSSAVLSLIISMDAARILGIFPMPAKSHFSFSHAIMKNLHEAGHQITVISAFPSDEKVENFTYVDSRLNKSTGLFVELTLEDYQNMTLALVADADGKYCHDVMQLKEIQKALNSPVKLYDVIFFEILMTYQCYLAIAGKLDIPAIATVPLQTWKQADIAIGHPNNPAVIPAHGIWTVPSKPELNIFERIQSLCHDLKFVFNHMTAVRKTVNKLYQKYFNEDVLQKKDISLVFYNGHFSFLPRPLTPNAIEVGGIQIKPAKKLPEKLQKFIDEATHGVVVFSLGSSIKGSSLPLEKRTAFLAAFASIPQRVIWKYEERIENLPKNVMLSRWIPQRDILEHKNVIAFMSHCGQTGTFEAIMTGTPVIAIPICYDHPQNAAHLLRHGVAVNLNINTMTKETVLNALNMIINDTSFYDRMQVLSRIFKDRPMSPEKSVVYWTEYVIRYNGAPHLKALGAEMSLFKYFMLDIILLVLIIVIIIFYITCTISRKIYRYMLRENEMKTLSKKKN